MVLTWFCCGITIILINIDIRRSSALFKFAILGAGKIAVKFVEAARLAGCEVVAVASRSSERAQAFAATHGIAHAYGDYAQLLDAEHVDCAYIATIPATHFELTRLCLERSVPVLCEKAMFCNLREADAAFGLASSRRTFAMEALWSKFLPANLRARRWLREGAIGAPVFCDASIGFRAPADDSNRYFNPDLGGGAALDITVYAYELTAFMMGCEPDVTDVQVTRHKTGVDASELITLRADNCLCTLRTSFMAPLNEGLTLIGEHGRIHVPHPHFASEALLYDESDKLVEHFKDDVTRNGFVYEIEEVVRCVREGRIESPEQPHSATLACARLFDLIAAK